MKKMLKRLVLRFALYTHLELEVQITWQAMYMFKKQDVWGKHNALVGENITQ